MRVKMPDGRLLLMEVEDLNPYLSLDLLSNQTRDKFIKRLTDVLVEYVKM